MTIPPDELFGVVHKLAPLAEGLGIEQVVVRGRMPDPASGELRERALHISNPIGRGLLVRLGGPATAAAPARCRSTSRRSCRSASAA